MQKITAIEFHKSSVSLSKLARRRIKICQQILLRHGIFLTDGEVYERILKLYLNNWAGHGKKSATARRYNKEGKGYKICSLYINKILYSAVWERAIHSGESVSRILDVAIRVYMARMLEMLLSRRVSPFQRERNIRYWGMRLARRTKQYPDFFLSYECRTETNNFCTLKYQQITELISVDGLPPSQIEELSSIAA
ncbi:MAG: hypothetical protein LDLANPLL_01075 [Turneriella sp.]|nr:hypothetical protein [Turneriella sp.]